MGGEVETWRHGGMEVLVTARGAIRLQSGIKIEPWFTCYRRREFDMCKEYNA